MAELNLDLERERARARKALAEERSKSLEEGFSPSSPVLRDKSGKTAETVLEVPSAETQHRLNNPVISGIEDAALAVPKGLYNAAAETVGMGLDVADTALGTEMGNAFRKSPLGPFVPTGDKSADFVTEATQIASGAATGGKVIKNTLGKIGGASMAGRLARGAGIGVGAAAGGVAAMDKDTPRLFVNESDSAAIPDFIEDSWTPPLDPDAPDSLVRLKAAGDLFQEALVIGAGMGMAGVPLRKAGGYVGAIGGNILNASKKDVLENGFAKDFYEIAAGITPDMSREERDIAIEKFLSAMKKNEQEIIQLGDADLPDIELPQDTIDKVIQTLDPKNPDHLERINVLEGLRSTALQGRHSPKLEITLGAPKRALDETLEGVQSTRGGPEAITKSTDKIVEEALGQVRPFKDKVTSANADLVLANRGLNKTMKEDNAFSDVLDRTTDDVNVFTTKPVTDISDDITTRVRGVDESMTAEKNRLYGAIPEATPVDQTLLNDAVEKAMPALNDGLRKGLGDAGSSFKKLSEFASNDLERYRQALRSEKKFAEADMIRDLQRNINVDQLDFIAKNTDPVTAKAAQDAKKYYVEQYAPKFREGVGPDLQNNTRTMSKVDAQVENRVQIENTLSDNRRPEYSDKIIDILSTSTKDTPGNPQLALDFGMATIAKKFQSVINEKGVVDADTMGKLAAEVDRFQPIIQKLAPQKQKEINDFLTSIRDKNFNVKEVQDKLTGFQRGLTEAEDRFLGDYMQGFFKKGSDGYTALPDGFKSLNGVFNDTQKADQLRRIKLAVSNDPVAARGLEAAWAKSLSKHLSGNTVSTSDIPDGLLSSAKIVFEEQPLIVDGIQEVIKRAQRGERANTLRQGGGFDAGASQSARTVGVNTVITWVWGVLNPTAAKLRTVTRDSMNANSAKPVAQQAIDTILADKDAFLKIAQRAHTKEKSKLTLREKQALFRSMVKAGLYEPEDEAKVVGSGDLDEQTEMALPPPPKF